jgi:hypothetical protein
MAGSDIALLELQTPKLVDVCIGKKKINIYPTAFMQTSHLCHFRCWCLSVLSNVECQKSSELTSHILGPGMLYI